MLRTVTARNGKTSFYVEQCHGADHAFELTCMLGLAIRHICYFDHMGLLATLVH